MDKKFKLQIKNLDAALARVKEKEAALLDHPTQTGLNHVKLAQNYQRAVTYFELLQAEIERQHPGKLRYLIHPGLSPAPYCKPEEQGATNASAPPCP